MLEVIDPLICDWIDAHPILTCGQQTRSAGISGSSLIFFLLAGRFCTKTDICGDQPRLDMSPTRTTLASTLEKSLLKLGATEPEQ